MVRYLKEKETTLDAVIAFLIHTYALAYFVGVT